MKSILIIGTSDGGKSTTITELCKKLQPAEVYKLNISQKILETATVDDIFNNTFIIRVREKYVLVVAGAPTEQNIKLKILIQITIEIKIEISLLIVAKRTIERKKGFNTIQDIHDNSKLLHTEKLKLIPLKNQKDKDSFKENQEWINRIQKLKKIVLQNI